MLMKMIFAAGMRSPSSFWGSVTIDTFFCDARRLQSNCQSNDVWSGRGDYFDHSAFCKLESNNSLNWTTSGRAGISWVCIKHCQRHNGPEGWVHLAKVRLQVQTQILNEFHLQNLDKASTRNLNKTSASPLNLKFKILTKPSFRISTKIQLHYLYKTSAAKYWPNSSLKFCLNLNFKILTKPCALSLNKSLTL